MFKRFLVNSQNKKNIMLLIGQNAFILALSLATHAHSSRKKWNDVCAFGTMCLLTQSSVNLLYISFLLYDKIQTVFPSICQTWFTWSRWYSGRIQASGIARSVHYQAHVKIRDAMLGMLVTVWQSDPIRKLAYHMRCEADLLLMYLLIRSKYLSGIFEM